MMSRLPPFFNELINFANVISNIDFTSLNNSILKLMKDVESICNLACTVNPSYDRSLSYYSLSLQLVLCLTQITHNLIA